MAKKTKLPTQEQLLDAKERLSELRIVQNQAREEEIAIRTWIADSFHNGEEGSKTITVDGLKLAIKRTLNYSITTADADLLHEEDPEAYGELLSFSPRVKTSAFKKLVDRVSKFVNVTAGPPSVDFK